MAADTAESGPDVEQRVVAVALVQVIECGIQMGKRPLGLIPAQGVVYEEHGVVARGLLVELLLVVALEGAAGFVAEQDAVPGSAVDLPALQ